jgi:hypothetical protein
MALLQVELLKQNAGHARVFRTAGKVTPLRRVRYRRDRARRGSSGLCAVLSSTTSAAG